MSITVSLILYTLDTYSRFVPSLSPLSTSSREIALPAGSQLVSDISFDTSYISYYHSNSVSYVSYDDTTSHHPSPAYIPGSILSTHDTLVYTRVERDTRVVDVVEKATVNVLAGVACDVYDRQGATRTLFYAHNSSVLYCTLDSGKSLASVVDSGSSGKTNQTYRIESGLVISDLCVYGGDVYVAYLDRVCKCLSLVVDSRCTVVMSFDEKSASSIILKPVGDYLHIIQIQEDSITRWVTRPDQGPIDKSLKETITLPKPILITASTPRNVLSMYNLIAVTGNLKSNGSIILYYFKPFTQSLGEIVINPTSASSFARPVISVADNSKVELVLYRPDSNKLTILSLDDYCFQIQGNSTDFNTGNPHKYSVKQLINGNESTLDIQVKSLFTPYDSPRFDTSRNRIFLFSGHEKQTFDILYGSWGGNSPVWTATPNLENTTLTVSYIEDVTLEISLESADLPATDFKNVGVNVFCLKKNNYIKLFKCSLNASSRAVACRVLFNMTLLTEVVLVKATRTSVFVITLLPATSPSSSVVNLYSLMHDGSDYAPQKSYTVRGQKPLAGIRQFDEFMVMAIISRFEAKETIEINLMKFKEEEELPEAFSLNHYLPFSKICPVGSLWSPKKEATFFIESQCSDKKKVLFEIPIDLEMKSKREVAPKNSFTVSKSSGNSKICVSRTWIIDINYDTQVITAFDRRQNSEGFGKYYFPFKEIGMSTIVNHSCSGENNAFQVLAKSGSSLTAKYYIVTYRTDLSYNADIRIHSLNEIQLEIPSIITAGLSFTTNDIFTVVFDPIRGKIAAYEYVLDTPAISVNASRVQREASAQIELRMKSFGVNNYSISSTISASLLSPLDALSVKEVVKKEFESYLNLDEVLEIQGTAVSFELNSKLEDRSSLILIPRLKHLETELSEHKGKFEGVKISGNTVFLWDKTSVTVILNSVKVARFPGLYIKCANTLSIPLKSGPNGSQPSFTTNLVGLSIIPGSLSSYLFVIFQSDENTWKVSIEPVNTGVTELKAFLVDPEKKIFAFVAEDYESDSIRVTRFRTEMSKTQQGIAKIYKLDSSVVKVTDQKLGNVEAFYIRGVLRIMYGEKNSMQLGFVQLDVKNHIRILSKGRILSDLWHYFCTSRQELTCTENLNTQITKGELDSSNFTNLTASCVAQTNHAFNRYFEIQWPEDPKLVPETRRVMDLPNVQGFEPLTTRIRDGYVGVLYRKVVDASKNSEIFQRSPMLNQNYTLQVFKIGSNKTIQLITLGALGLPDTVPIDSKLKAEIDFGQGPKMYFACGFDNQPVKVVRISELGLNVTGNIESIKDVFLNIVGLKGTQSMYLLSNSITFKPKSQNDNSSVKTILFLVVLAVIILFAIISSCKAAKSIPQNEIGPKETHQEASLELGNDESIL